AGRWRRFRYLNQGESTPVRRAGRSAPSSPAIESKKAGDPMNTRDPSGKAAARLRTTPLGLVAGVGLLAAAGLGTIVTAAAHDEPQPANFHGLINDYTPATVAGGPYEMHGKWQLELNERRGTATFAAEMSMETADFANPAAATNPGALGPHTHHISMTHAT